MERRVTSHTEEEELNQRKHLLDLARKGDKQAIDRLLELYQVRVYTGNNLPKANPPPKTSKTVKPVKEKKVVKEKPRAKISPSSLVRGKKQPKPSPKATKQKETVKGSEKQVKGKSKPKTR